RCDRWMIHPTSPTASDQITERLAEHGFGGLAKAVTAPLDEVMKIGRSHPSEWVCSRTRHRPSDW
ncbi:hypothetical protein ACYOEI_33080, partial [Singulisphaera rosea]